MNLTIKEQERIDYINGTPMPKKMLELVEAGENIPTSVGDISAGFPDEGFLNGAIDSLNYLIKHTHKNNKLIPKLVKIRDALSERQDEIVRSAEYGYSELERLKEALGI
ncbi:hypothetical protein D3C87_325120 [compost metagenome]